MLIRATVVMSSFPQKAEELFTCTDGISSLLLKRSITWTEVLKHDATCPTRSSCYLNINQYNYRLKSQVVIPRECHTECAKSDRKGEISYDIPHMWNLKRNDTNKLIKQKETHRLRKRT